MLEILVFPVAFVGVILCFMLATAVDERINADVNGRRQRRRLDELEAWYDATYYPDLRPKPCDLLNKRPAARLRYRQPTPTEIARYQDKVLRRYGPMR